jgi:hypothetical protein
MAHITMELESLWNEILNRYSPTTIEIIGTFIVQITVFWDTVPKLFGSGQSWHHPSLNGTSCKKIGCQFTFDEIKQCSIVVLKNQVTSGLLHFFTFNYHPEKFSRVANVFRNSS